MTEKWEELINNYDGDYVIEYYAIHAPYVEFGTEPHYVGKRGLKNLEGWAHRKLDLSEKEAKEAAQRIAWKIFHHGTDPQPFLRPAVDLGKAQSARLFREGYTLEDVVEFIFNESQDIINRKRINDEGTLLGSGLFRRIR